MVWVTLGRGLVEEIEPMSNSAKTFIACCLAQEMDTAQHSERSRSNLNNSISDTTTLKHGTHYACPRAVCDTRVRGPWTRVVCAELKAGRFKSRDSEHRSTSN